jgi:Protein of Unknown function (DUF2784)
MHAASSLYSSLAIFVLLLHALFILWVVFGALLTRSRPVLRWLHIASLVWGILTELLPWPCPLTDLENWSKAKLASSHTRVAFCSITWTSWSIPTSPQLC